MDKSVGVGMIVGLAIVSFLYVLNSDSFTKSQKAVILTLIIFPPAHWFVLIAVLIYNNNFTKDAVETNKVIKEVEKINESKTTLEQLKQKGILTEEEYKNKVEQLNIEENEKALKNSTEYKQLKSLFDSGILTKEEFEEKIEILSKKSIKESDEIKTFVSVNNFKTHISEINLPNYIREALKNNNSTLKHFISEIKTYVGMYKTETFPYLVALELDNRGISLNEDEIEKLKEFSNKTFSTKDLDCLFEKMKNDNADIDYNNNEPFWWVEFLIIIGVIVILIIGSITSN
jgi:competence protein ComGC